MELSPEGRRVLSRLPAVFYDLVIREVPEAAWDHILGSYPNQKKKLLEGYSGRKGKGSQVCHRPSVMERIRGELQTDTDFFEKVLTRWRVEKPLAVSYLAMFGVDFISKNLWKLRDLLGPARFCAGLFSLGLLELEGVSEAMETEGFWARPADAALFEILVPTLSVWGEFIENHPDISAKFLESKAGGGFLFDLESDLSEEEDESAPGCGGTLKKVEKKLKKVQAELVRTTGQLGGLRAENEDLRNKINECEAEFEMKLSEAIRGKRKEWFARYQSIDTEGAAKEAQRIESLLQRTRRALELQKKADEEYGLLSDIRARLLEIDLSLERIETVYANSLFVHKEVEKVKEALLTEKNRLLKLPGVGRIIGAERGGAGEIVSRINLLDPVPANLPKIREMVKMSGALFEMGLIKDPAGVEEAVHHKRRQIFERLYFRFQPKAKEFLRRGWPRRLDDFIKSGQSRRYDLFIDGYNVLFRAHGEGGQLSGEEFTRFRNRFIEAVSAKSAHFARVFLVFDGVEESSSVAANLQIIYTDRATGSADDALIEKIGARRDGKVLLVTGDEGIISAVEKKIFALVDVAEFYMFLFE